MACPPPWLNQSSSEDRSASEGSTAACQRASLLRQLYEWYLLSPTPLGNQVRLGLPPQAAPAVGRPQGADAPMDQSREAHYPAWPLHSPEGAYSESMMWGRGPGSDTGGRS